MAGEGLFFAGTVLKNNRNLLEEEATRQQLDMQREELELKKQAAADKRKDARSKGQKANLQDYSLDGINPLFVSDFQSNVAGYQDFANNNAMSIFDGDTGLKNEQSSQERDLSALSNNYISLSSDITSLDSLVKNNKGGQLKLAENGEYLYVHNMSKIGEVTQGENAISMSEALELYPIDAQSMINKTEWADPTKALFDADDSDDNRKVVSNDGEYNYTEIEPQKMADTQTAITNSLKVNSQGFHNDTNYKRLYDTKLLTIDGNEMTAKEAFFLEAYIDPETEQKGGITGSDSLLEMLDPESKLFKKDVSNAYAEYLGKKISEEGYENKGRKQGGKFVGETSAEKKNREDEEAQLQYNIDIYNDIKSTATVEELGYQVHASKYTGAENSQNNKVDIKLSDIKGTTQGTAMETASTNDIDSENGMAKVIVLGVTLDGDGQVVARVRHVKSETEAYVSWNKVASKQIYDAMRPEGKQLIDYKQPETKTTAGDFDNG